MKKITIGLIIFLFFNKSFGQNRLFYDQVKSVTLLPNGITVNSENTNANNFFMGKGAFSNKFGQQNTVVGINALDSSNVFQNTIVGSNSGRKLGSIFNVIIGGFNFPSHNTGLAITSIGAVNAAFGNSQISTNPNFASSYITNIGAANIPVDSAITNTTLIGSNIGGSLRQSNASVLIGYQAANNQKKIDNSTLIGHRAGFSYLGESQNMNFMIGDEVGSRSSSSAGNVMVGYRALYGNNAKTFSNVGIGYLAFFNLIDGSQNVAIGEQSSLNLKQGIHNVSAGNFALAKLDTGEYNIGIGAYAGAFPFLGGNENLIGLRKGNHNIAIGHYTLLSPEVISNTIAIGYAAFNYLNSNQLNNTAIGYISGENFENGTGSTFIGNLAGGTIGATINNATAIGNGVKVTAHNQIFLGNSAVTTVRIFSPWTNYSDQRLKKNIQYDNSLGLNFINSLRPALYNYKTHTNKDLQIGFIADDVFESIENSQIKFSGFTHIDDIKALNYDTFVIPLINAAKELDKKLDSPTTQSSLNEYLQVLNKLELNTK